MMNLICLVIYTTCLSPGRTSVNHWRPNERTWWWQTLMFEPPPRQLKHPAIQKSRKQLSCGLEHKCVRHGQAKPANQGAWGNASHYFFLCRSPESEKDILTNLLFLFLFEFCLCCVRKQLFRRERSVYINPEDKPPEITAISDVVFKVADCILFEKKTPSSSSCTQNTGHSNNFFPTHSYK